MEIKIGFEVEARPGQQQNSLILALTPVHSQFLKFLCCLKEFVFMRLILRILMEMFKDMMKFRKDLRNKLEDQAFIFEKLFGNACLVNPHLQLSHFISLKSLTAIRRRIKREFHLNVDQDSEL